MAGKQIPDAVKARIAESLKHTGNLSETAAQLGIHRDTVRRWRDWMPAGQPVPALASSSLKSEPLSADPVGQSRLQRKVAELEKDKRELLGQVEEMQRLNSLFGFVNEARLSIPEWTRRKPVMSKKQAIACVMLSDLHLDEIVHPAQINFVNEYNREIAERRLENFFHNVVKLAQDYVQGLKYEGAVVCLGGDLFSGIIHQELRETNAATIFESLLYWAEPMCAGLRMLRDAFGRLYVPAVVGNHGRNQHKPHAKNRPQDNFDWFFAHLLRKLLAEEKGISFDVSEAADHAFTIFDTRYLLTHGDQFRGGSGIAGLLSPLMIGDSRKRKRESAVNRPYDFMVMGHWHQLAHFKGLIVNGCFPAGSKVLTSTGMCDINILRKGDTVMSRDGSKQEITHVFTKEADRLIGLKIAGLPDVVEATPNHLIWAAKRASSHANVTPVRRNRIGVAHGPAQWIPIDFLSPGDYVHVPFPKGNERPVDSETAWAYGLYLAEGNALLDGGSSKKHNRINLTMHSREKGILDRWAAWFESKFSKKPRVVLRKNRNTSDLTVSAGREVSLWFRETFGHGAVNKHLPSGALWWADDLKAALLEGWITGDGHSAQQPDCRPTVSATSISKQLAWGMFYLAPASGYWPTLAKLSKGGRRKSDSYTVHFNVGQNITRIDGEVFYQIAERFETQGKIPVFDLEVSGEHTYTVGGIGVHNSLKGYDEYAYLSNFDFEPPQQAFWVTSPLHGKTIDAPIHVQDERERYKGAQTLPATVAAFGGR